MQPAAAFISQPAGREWTLLSRGTATPPSGPQQAALAKAAAGCTQSKESYRLTADSGAIFHKS
ncbi:MAG: hypothetical protein ABIS50_08090 [Luteolibacter sp.]